MGDCDVSKEKKPKLLSWIWQTFAVVATTMSFSNIIKDFIQWIDILADVLATYRAIIDPIFHIIEIVLPFSIPELARDYIVIGTICHFGFIRQSIHDEIKYYTILPKIGLFIFFLIISIPAWIMTILLWPIALIGTLVELKKPELALSLRKKTFFVNADIIKKKAWSQIRDIVFSFSLVFFLMLANLAILQVWPEAKTPNREPQPVWEDLVSV